FRRAVVSRSSRLTPVTVYSTSELTLRYVTVNLLLGSVYLHHRGVFGDRRSTGARTGWARRESGAAGPAGGAPPSARATDPAGRRSGPAAAGRRLGEGGRLSCGRAGQRNLGTDRRPRGQRRSRDARSLRDR